MCQICGYPDNISCNCETAEPYCDQCGNDNPCEEKMDAQCVFFDLGCTENDQLPNLGINCNTDLATILHKLDTLVGSNFNIPFEPIETATVRWVAGGAAGHKPRAHVKLSEDAGNAAEEREDGVYVPTPVIPEPTPPPVFIDETNDCISIAVTQDEDGAYHITPSLDVVCLLEKIRDEQPTLFCEIIALCNPPLAWIADTFACQTEELDLITQKTISNSGNPALLFQHGGFLYVVNLSSPTGKVFRLNPATATSMLDAVYINETRSGTPYGAGGGTYVAGGPYTGDHDANLNANSIINGAFYDEATETLFVHGRKTYGMDYLDLNTLTWGKVGVGGTGSAYNTTLSTDFYTHTPLSSSQSTSILLAGWGTNAGDRGRYVITVNKATRTMIAEIDSVSTVFTPTLTGNPFTDAWEAFFTDDNRILVSKGASAYKDIAVFNTALTPIFEIAVANATVGFNSSGLYWAACYLDAANDKFYYLDYLSRTIDVFDTNTYVLLKTFNLDNNSNFPAVVGSFSLLPVTGELFINAVYSDTSAIINQDGINDALATDTITYKINRSTLEIEKIYIGESRNLFIAASATQYASAAGIGAEPSELAAPANPGSITFFVENPSALTTGIKNILTLQEINSVTEVPTGNTKPNTIGDPDYIAPAQDLVDCPVSYTLAAPSRIISTVRAASYVFEFGLNADVYSNPVLAVVEVTLRNTTTASVIDTVSFSIPNTPNIAAFFDAVTIATGTAGQGWAIDIKYYDSLAANIATFNNIATGTILA
jgi:hypothetical protein